MRRRTARREAAMRPRRAAARGTSLQSKVGGRLIDGLAVLSGFGCRSNRLPEGCYHLSFGDCQ
jgi:hypothetical protein